MIIRRKSLVTVDILYWMPDYDNILQEFVWQTKDVVPEIPRVHKFLDYWHKNIDAVIAIGCIIQGETRHFEFVSNAVVNGIKDLNVISDIPVILCVSTDDNISQSIDRSGGKYNKGEDSAIAALKMITFNQ